MRTNLKACGQALTTALVNAVLAVALMVIAEFAFTGSFSIATPYIIAGLLIGLVIFTAQFWRQRHLCRRCRHADEHNGTA
ncbi:MAG TPA: hypothetical protein DHU56_05470 [Marinobacter sp.]|nr:hypothetical protein [Marinobacter sp.]